VSKFGIIGKEKFADPLKEQKQKYLNVIKEDSGFHKEKLLSNSKRVYQKRLGKVNCLSAAQIVTNVHSTVKAKKESKAAVMLVKDDA
jgi:hypothetical protein